MPNYTPNYRLIKPNDNEYFDIANDNSNMDIIDSEIKKVNSQLNDMAYNNCSLNVGIGLGRGTPDILNIDLIEEYNFKNIRMAFYWEKVEKTKGVYDFSYYDSVIKGLANRGIKIIFSFSFEQQSLYTSTKNVTNENVRNAFMNFVLATVERYKDYNVIWECWNEPNLELFWEDQSNSAYYYYLLMKDFYLKIKNIDKNNLIAGCPIAQYFNTGDYYTNFEIPKFFKAFCNYGGLNYIDILSYHLYSITKPEDLLFIHDTYRNYISNFTNQNIQIYVGEFGYAITPNYTSGDNKPVGDDTLRSKYILRTILTNIINSVSMCTIHEFWSEQTNTTDSKYWFSMFNKDYSPTVSVNNLKSFLTYLGEESKFLYFENPRSDIYIMYFKKVNNDVVSVYWTTEINSTLEFIWNNISYAVTDLPQVKSIPIDKIDINKAIEYQKNNINPGNVLNMVYSKCGRKTVEEGEVFNNYKYNYATKNGTSMGYATLACPAKYMHTIISVAGSIASLDNTDGLSIGNIVYIKNSLSKFDEAKILSINSNDVTLDIALSSNSKYLLYDDGDNNFIASFASGIDTLSCGAGSHAEGRETIASKYYSHAEGDKTKALETASHTEGRNTVAKGVASHAEGNESTSNAYASHAEGDKTTASGASSHAEGSQTTASGNISHAEGSQTTASGIASHASGVSTKASNYSSTSIGKFTKNMNDGGTISNQIGDVFVIGNGTNEENRSNAFRVNYIGATYGLSAFNASGADFAEFHEWVDGNKNGEDRVGYFVTNKGKQIEFAKENDFIIGVISGNPCLVGNSDEDWTNRYLKDDFGRFIYEDAEEEIEQTDKETGEMTFVKTGNIIKNGRFKLNPNYDNSKEYIERKERKEWDYVCKRGMIAVRDDGTCKVGKWCKCTNESIATITETREFDTYMVLERINENIILIEFK